jgi:hypothetical protein
MNPFSYAIKFIRSLRAGSLAAVATQQTLHALRRDLFFQWFSSTDRFNDPKRLFKSSFKVLSEANEDGAIDDIFQRIGTDSRFFIEVGVADGLECNTAFLLTQGWRGVWIECSKLDVDRGRRYFADYPVRIVNQRVSPQSIDSAIEVACGGTTVDLLSIDIDSYDYYLWENIRCIRPRVVVIEYNASFPPRVCAAIAHREGYQPAVGTLYFGASLGALVKLGQRKGYSLVGCSISGVNAFFVRDDLVQDHFRAPYTAENHYEPPRYGLIGQVGHGPSMGPWVNVR